MPMVTVFRGNKFDGAEEIDDYDCPTVPRIGDTFSLFDHDRATFEEVIAVNFHADTKGVLTRILVKPNAENGMKRVTIGGM